jgi:hypothetical protein
MNEGSYKENYHWEITTKQKVQKEIKHILILVTLLQIIW